MSWIQSLKTLNGLADGTREWRNCFLAAATHVGFETSVLEPCVLVLRSPQTGHHGIIGVAVGDIASGGDDVWEQAISELKQRPLVDTGNCAKGNSAGERSHRLQMEGSMRVSNLEMRPSWNDTPCDQCWEPLVVWLTRAGPTGQGQFQPYRAVSTTHMCWTSKRKTAR